jgi:hypothetical protein
VAGEAVFDHVACPDSMCWWARSPRPAPYSSYSTATKAAFA